MSVNVTFTNSASTAVILNTPEYGYRSTITMPLDVTRLDNRAFAAYDNGTAYDRRECRCRFYLTAAMAAEWSAAFLADRASDWTMAIAEGSGWFPFGPDKGDVGTFTVSLVSADLGPRMAAPWGYFPLDLTIVNTGSYPAYVIPTPATQGGAVALGTVTGIRYPQGGYGSIVEHARGVVVTEGSDASYTDKSNGGDGYTSKITLYGTPDKIGQIVAYLTATTRGNTFTYTATAGHYAFGLDKGSAGSYTARLRSGDLPIDHVDPLTMTLDIDIVHEATL